jgi:hypothetical protein
MGMLRSVWEELDYRIDICHVTKGSHRILLTYPYKLQDKFFKPYKYKSLKGSISFRLTLSLSLSLSLSLYIYIYIYIWDVDIRTETTT